MKKLIAISVMFALFIGAAFADTTVGGVVFVGGAFLKGDNTDDNASDKVVSHVNAGAVKVDGWNSQIKLTFGDNDAGGWFGIHNNGNFYHWFGWWRPIPQLRLQVGSNKDGNFGTAQISGWGFTGEAKNVEGSLAAMGEYGNGHKLWSLDFTRASAWYDGTGGTPNFQMSLYPIEGLSVNMFIPFVDGPAAESYANLNLQVQYRITDIGVASVSYIGGVGYHKADANEWWGDSDVEDKQPKIFASFYLNAIQGMGIDLGFGFTIPQVVTGKVPGEDGEETATLTTNYPFDIGLGFSATAGNFTFKLRGAFEIGPSLVVDTKVDEYKEAVKAINKGSETKVAFNILPSYKINNLTVYLYAGLGISSVNGYKEAGIKKYKDSESDSIAEWFVNPYVLISAGSMRFFTGFQLWSDGIKVNLDNPNKNGKLDGAEVLFAIPFGFYCYF